MAQQPDEQSSPAKKKGKQEQGAEAKPGANAARPQQSAARERGQQNQPGPGNERGAATQRNMTNERGAAKGRNARPNQESATAPGASVSGQATGSASPGAKQQRAEQGRKGMRGRAAEAGTSATPATAASASAAPSANAARSPAAATQQRGQANAGAGNAAKKPAPQQVQQIKQQHANFRAQPKPEQVPAVTFNQNYQIQGSQSWTGPQYEVFRSYRPQWHDEGWYRSHFGRVELIGGGYYYFNNGYWYPAWGYSPSAQYYAYDGPIYVGHRAEPPDRVIADVQAELQEMGYYKGEVDGLLGPLTREALTAYQSDQGLTQTAAIDEPTLDSLGMS